MSSLTSRSLVLFCGSLTMALAACAASPDVNEDIEPSDEEGGEVSQAASSGIPAKSLIKEDSLKTYLRAMWKKELNTSHDPPNNKWFTKGADGDDPAGLYGALTLTNPSSIIIDHAKRTYKKSVVVEDDCITDNKNGLNPELNCTLTSTFTKISSTAHTVEDSITLGVSYAVKGSATLFGLGTEATTTFKFDYTHKWAETKTDTDQIANAFATTCKTQVPKGKIYKCKLKGVIREFTAPYKAVLQVGGFTETWFEHKVQNHYNWSLSGAGAFSRIGSWGLAGGDSSHFSSAGLTQNGTLYGSMKGSFSTVVVDITPKSKVATPSDSAMASDAKSAQDEAWDEEGQVISVTPIPDEALQGLEIKLADGQGDMGESR